MKEIGITNVKITTSDIVKAEGKNLKEIKTIILKDKDFGILKSVIKNGKLKISLGLRGNDLFLKLDYKWEAYDSGGNGENITFHFDGKSWEIW